MWMCSKGLKTGKRAKAKTSPDTGTWFVGLSVTGSWIGIELTSGCRVGTQSTQDLFWNEMSLINGKKETEATHGND